MGRTQDAMMRGTLAATFVFFLGMTMTMAPQSSQMPDLSSLRAMTARFAPVEISADVSALPSHERQALARLVAARLLAQP